MPDDAKLDAALDAENQGQFHTALKTYRSLLERNPRDEAALLGVGRVRLLMGHLDKAVEDFTVVLVGNPLSAEAYRGRGVAFFNSGLLEKAFDDLDKAIGLAPDDVDVRLSRGQVARDLGLLDVSQSDLERAYGAAPDDPDVCLELARTLCRTDDARDHIDRLRVLLDSAAEGFGVPDPLVGLLQLTVRRLAGGTVDKVAILSLASEDEEVAEEVAAIPVLAALIG